MGFGCPTADKKVVFSSKLLRKHVHLDEGDVSVGSLSITGTYYLYLHLVLQVSFLPVLPHASF